LCLSIGGHRPCRCGGRPCQSQVDRANAEWEGKKQGWRSGDDLPGRSVADQAQALVDALLGRSRLAMAEAGAGAGRSSGGRTEFDEGGGSGAEGKTADTPGAAQPADPLVPQGDSPGGLWAADGSGGRPDLTPEENFPGKQSGKNCAPQACQQIIKQATGKSYTEAQMEQMGQDSHAYDPKTGTRAGGEADILKQGGVDARTQAQTPENIQKALDSGQGVITAHSAGRLWEGDPNYEADPAYPMDDVGHSVHTTGMVRDANGSVTHYVINDTGTGTSGRMVPADHFHQSLDGHAAVMTDVLHRLIAQSGGWGQAGEAQTALRGQLVRRRQYLDMQAGNYLKAIGEGRNSNYLLNALEKVETEQQAVLVQLEETEYAIRQATIKRPSAEQVSRAWGRIGDVWPVLTEDERIGLLGGVVQGVEVTSKESVTLELLPMSHSPILYSDKFALNSQMGAGVGLEPTTFGL
jgi:hypothetical protein